MREDIFSTYWSDDKSRSALVYKIESAFKVSFEDHNLDSSTFKYFLTESAANDAAEDFVMYQDG